MALITGSSRFMASMADDRPTTYAAEGCFSSTQTDYLPQHFLYFFPLPQGHGSFLPTFRFFACSPISPRRCVSISAILSRPPYCAKNLSIAARSSGISSSFSGISSNRAGGFSISIGFHPLKTGFGETRYNSFPSSRKRLIWSIVRKQIFPKRSCKSTSLTQDFPSHKAFG